ncbi:MAG TPA: CopG family transcriptional regulator [Thermoanaerobaculia bacterium]|nr:CopG family transcriptional regulator [Thermoanaerobaculia bacterium]
MKRTTVFLDETVERRLEQQARRRRLPKAVLIREALKEYLDRRSSAGSKRFGFIAAGHSGRSDVAERHEDLLWRDRESEGTDGS